MCNTHPISPHLHWTHLLPGLRYHVHSGSLCSSAMCQSVRASPPEWSVIHSLRSTDKTRLWCQLVKCGELRRRQRQRWQQERGGGKKMRLCLRRGSSPLGASQYRTLDMNLKAGGVKWKRSGVDGSTCDTHVMITLLKTRCWFRFGHFCSLFTWFLLL